MKALSKHSDIQRQRLKLDRDRDGDKNRDRNKTETHTVIFSKAGVPPPAARGFGGKKGTKAPKATLYVLNASKGGSRCYEWPEALFPLRDWLRKFGVDVGALKSERQSLWVAKSLGRQGKRMPHRLAPLFPELLKVQRTLCPSPAKPLFPSTRKASEERGTFGAASPVRSISVAQYLSEKEKG